MHIFRALCLSILASHEIRMIDSSAIVRPLPFKSFLARLSYLFVLFFQKRFRNQTNQ